MRVKTNVEVHEATEAEDIGIQCDELGKRSVLENSWIHLALTKYEVGGKGV